MERLKPDKIKGIRVSGKVIDSEEGKWFTFSINPRSRDLKETMEELRPRTQKVENGHYKYFKDVLRGSHITLSYLNEESLKGLYKNQENNLPYEIFLSSTGSTIYRESIIDKKEEIFRKLEKTALEERLR